MRLLWLDGGPHLFAMVVASCYTPHDTPEGLGSSGVLERFIDHWLIGYLTKNVRFSSVRYDAHAAKVARVAPRSEVALATS